MSMSDMLQKIVAHKKEEVASRKQSKPLAELKKSKLYDRECNRLSERLQDERESGVIAEFKRKSPSKQSINLDADLSKVVSGYVAGGASAISVLTDEHFFGGSDDYLRGAREIAPTTPLLRKDFIIDEYQIHEAKAIGADIILLIAEILTAAEIDQFAAIARSLGMDVLMELHSESHLAKLSEHVTLLGINNRDLDTFEVDYDRSMKLYDQLPDGIPKIAESGLSDPQKVAMLYQHGFRGFLIGEHFMKTDDPGRECQQMIQEYSSMVGI